MIQHGGRFRMTATKLTPSYKIHMELRITGVRGSDFGAYRCIAKNPRGSTDGEITLTEEIVPTTTSLSTTAITIQDHTSTTRTQTTIHFLEPWNKALNQSTTVVVDIVPKGDRRSKENNYGSSNHGLDQKQHREEMRRRQQEQKL